MKENATFSGLLNELGAFKHLVKKYQHITLSNGNPRFSFRITKKYGKEDCSGKDIIQLDVLTQNKRVYQVKSSEYHARLFKGDYPDYTVMFPDEEGVWNFI